MVWEPYERARCLVGSSSIQGSVCALSMSVECVCVIANACLKLVICVQCCKKIKQGYIFSFFCLLGGGGSVPSCLLLDKASGTSCAFPCEMLPRLFEFAAIILWAQHYSGHIPDFANLIVNHKGAFKRVDWGYVPSPPLTFELTKKNWGGQMSIINEPANIICLLCSTCID